MVQGSKSLSPRRPRVRTSGSSVSAVPSGSAISVGVLIVSSSVPRRTFSPAMWKICISRCTFAR